MSLRRYMILDLKKFTPGRDLEAGLLWIAEQIPGLVASRDMTEQLARGYWPSYNIPYFPEVKPFGPPEILPGQLRQTLLGISLMEIPSRSSGYHSSYNIQ